MKTCSCSVRLLRSPEGARRIEEGDFGRLFSVQSLPLLQLLVIRSDLKCKREREIARVIHGHHGLRNGEPKRHAFAAFQEAASFRPKLCPQSPGTVDEYFDLKLPSSRAESGDQC